MSNMCTRYLILPHRHFTLWLVSHRRFREPRGHPLSAPSARCQLFDISTFYYFGVARTILNNTYIV